MRGTSLVARRCCYWQPRFPRNHGTVRACHKRQQFGIVLVRMAVTISMIIVSMTVAPRSAQAILDALERLLHLDDAVGKVFPILLTGALLSLVLAAGQLDSRSFTILEVCGDAERPLALARQLSPLRRKEAVLGTARAQPQSVPALHPEAFFRRLILEDDGLRLDGSSLGRDGHNL